GPRSRFEVQPTPPAARRRFHRGRSRRHRRRARKQSRQGTDTERSTHTRRIVSLRVLYERRDASDVRHFVATQTASNAESTKTCVACDGLAGMKTTLRTTAGENPACTKECGGSSTSVRS